MDKKPLWALTTLPVYSELIAALEKAKRSDCLTKPMAEELERLTFQCKRTGNAIIQKLPLPAEGDTIIVLDDNDKDLHTKYGFPFELPNANSNQNPDLTPSTSQNLIYPDKNKMLPTEERDNKQNNDKREDSNMKRVLESTPKSPNQIDVSEEVETFDQDTDSCNEGAKLIPPHVQYRQSETSSNESKSAPVVSQSTQSEKETVDPNSTLTSIQSKETECVMSQIDSLPTTNQDTNVENQTENSDLDPVVNQGPSSSTVKNVPNSTPNVVQSAESEMEIDESHSNLIIHQSSEPKIKFFIGLDQIKKELNELLPPYNGNQCSKNAKLIAWEALTSLLEQRRVGKPLDPEFLDSIDNGTNSVVIRTQFNAQTWFEAIQHVMPNLFNSHSGEPSYSVGLFNTTQLKKESMSDKVPHAGKTFLKEPPPSEKEKARTGIEAKAAKANDSKPMWLLDTNNLKPLGDIGLVQQWRDLFIKVLDAYVVQYFEAKLY
ncbi:uncharacterized protein MELLADRAFT_61030 [Melampsora larici-populina 98AG31]|uniref:Uncharacterized protein n=1 Tax=Melampsora larici-populina (strain 98AG31 / pathotype 3-4-7) TaxID=747676 RepID=F4RDB9_MELLP|nr:uncharacterized protein MELLADRAFT_61030 [Melampsora larici-populina 98AG31]EGG09635.1 hypothetical protein MELLADRAFT_61030 [Melampsora larici-populina 98AG31]